MLLGRSCRDLSSSMEIRASDDSVMLPKLEMDLGVRSARHDRGRKPIDVDRNVMAIGFRFREHAAEQLEEIEVHVQHLTLRKLTEDAVAIDPLPHSQPPRTQSIRHGLPSAIMRLRAGVVAVGADAHGRLEDLQPLRLPPTSSVQRDEIMVAVVLSSPNAIAVEELAILVHNKLPRFARPRFFEVVEQLPKTKTHKIQKSVLRERGITSSTWDAQHKKFSA
jgi:acyl-CoA synthetase (AMP-forming)/AMP-acid ligase II